MYTAYVKFIRNINYGSILILFRVCVCDSSIASMAVNERIFLLIQCFQRFAQLTMCSHPVCHRLTLIGRICVMCSRVEYFSFFDGCRRIFLFPNPYYYLL